MHKTKPSVLSFAPLLALLLTFGLPGCSTPDKAPISQSKRKAVDVYSKMPPASDIAWATKIIDARDQRVINRKLWDSPSDDEIILALRILKYGTPSHEEVMWANKIISMHDQEAAFSKQSEEFVKKRELYQQAADRLASKIRANKDVMDQIEKIKQDAKADLDQIAWLAKNKERLEEEFTAKGEPTRQQRFESYDLRGEVISAFVDDVETPGRNILEFSEVFVWKTPTGGVGVARATQWYNCQDNAWERHKLVSKRTLALSEAAQLTSSRMQPGMPSVEEPSGWEQNNTTMNKLLEFAAPICQELLIYAGQRGIDTLIQKLAGPQ